MKKKYKTTVVAILLFFITVTSIGVRTFADPKKLSLEQMGQSVQKYNSKIEFNMDGLNKSKKQIRDEENAIKNKEKYLALTEENVNVKKIQLVAKLKEMQFKGGVEGTSMQYLDNVYSSREILNTVKEVPLNFTICTGCKKIALGAKEKLTEIKEKIKRDREELEKSNKAKALIEESEKYLSVPYLWGGESPTGFDCSGLMKYVFNRQGINIPRISQDQQSAAITISISEIKPGDLVFNKEAKATHVGMYIGNDMYIQSPSSGDVIKISKLSTSNMKYVGRILN